MTELDLPRCRRTAVEQSSEVARDITIAVVGATGAGRTTLTEALCSHRGVCGRASDLPTNKHGGVGSQRPISGLEVRYFEAKCPDGVAACSVGAFLVSNDQAFNYVRRFHVDLCLLVVDLTSFETSPRGGASSVMVQQQQQRQRQQSSSRCVTRLQMWLKALADVASKVPDVILRHYACSGRVWIDDARSAGKCNVQHYARRRSRRNRDARSAARHAVQHYARSGRVWIGDSAGRRGVRSPCHPGRHSSCQTLPIISRYGLFSRRRMEIDL